MKVEFTLPRSFQPAEFLTLRQSLKSDDARWLVSTILRKMANRDVDPWGCVRLHSAVMRRVMTPNTISSIVKRLVDGGAIEVAPYHTGVKCKGYRLAKRYLGDRCVRKLATDPLLIQRIEAERKRQEQEDQRTRWKPIHYLLNDQQHFVTITTDANEVLDTLPHHSRLCQDVLVSRLRSRQFSFSVSSTGRVFNSISGLKRELRPSLRLAGEPMGSVDLVNAQPALLALMIHQQNTPSEVKGAETYKEVLVASPVPASLPADCVAFRECACDGRLYEQLMLLTGLDRATVKQRFLVDVLAKRGRYPSRVEQAFRKAFPSVWKFIKDTNQDDHSELIRMLQGAESGLVIHQVAPRLIGRIPMLTLHDAIYSRHRDVEEVVSAFDSVFGELDFRLSLKRE